MSPRRIEVEIVGDSRSLERAFARSERSAKKFQGTMAATSRKMSGSLGMFGVSGGTAAAGGAFLLGRQFVKAARDAEVILGQTSIAVKDAGLSWVRYSKQVEDASKRISNSSAFDDEAVLQSFQVFVRGQKDVEKSLRLTELAADVARGRYIDLDQATQLVNKAAMGQIGALRRAGIQIDKNATSAQALDALLKAYSGSAKTYADSATGSSEKLAVAWENLGEVAGGPLSDGLAVLADELTLVVGLMEKAGKLKFPGLPFGGGGGSVGDAAGKAALTVGAPGLAIAKLFGLGGGRKASIAGGSGMGGIGSIADSIIAALTGAGRGVKAASAIGTANSTLDQLTQFIGKYTEMGRKFEDAQKAQQQLLDQTQLNVDRTALTDTLQDDLTALTTFKGILQNIIATQGSTLEMERQLLTVELSIKGVQDQIAANRQAAAAKARRAAADARAAAAEKRRAAIEERFGWLNFAVEKAGATPGTSDDMTAYKRLEQALLTRIRKEGRTLELTRDLWQARQNIRDLNKKELDKATSDVQAIQTTSRRLFQHLNAAAFLSTFGDDLTRTQKHRLSVGLAMMGPGGTLPAARSGQFTAGITIHGGVHMHGVNDVAALENQIAKRAKARPHVRRGARG